MKTKADKHNLLKQQLANHMIEALLPYLKGWIRTVGMAGSPRNKKVPVAARVTAAKAGIDLATKLMDSNITGGGEDLLKQLEALDALPPELDYAMEPVEEDPEEDSEDDDPDADGSQGLDWTEDAELPGQATDME